MTDTTGAPERLYAAPSDDGWEAPELWKIRCDDTTVYIREDISDAHVAAAYEAAAKAAEPRRKKPKADKGNWFHGYTKNESAIAALQVRKQIAENIRDLTPADAKAALDRLIREAEERGMKAAHAAVSELPEDAPKFHALEAILVAMLRHPQQGEGR
jgi:hypothetical protein